MDEIYETDQTDETNQINEIDDIDQTDQTNEMNETDVIDEINEKNDSFQQRYIISNMPFGQLCQRLPLFTFALSPFSQLRAMETRTSISNAATLPKNPVCPRKSTA